MLFGSILIVAAQNKVNVCLAFDFVRIIHYFSVVPLLCVFCMHCHRPNH